LDSSRHARSRIGKATVHSWRGDAKGAMERRREDLGIREVYTNGRALRRSASAATPALCTSDILQRGKISFETATKNGEPDDA
jgi:hypothetical protein